MVEKNCPSCGGTIRFEHAALPVQVCEYCSTMIRLEGSNLSEVGKCAVLPFDVSIIALGTRLLCTNGDSAGQRGEIVGRVRWGWEKGSWNEWLLSLPGDDYRWVAEESGLFMMMRWVEGDAGYNEACRELLKQGRNALGTAFDFEGTEYYLADVKTIRCISSEGALPEPTATGYEINTIDFRNASGGSLTYQIESGTGYFYVGEYVELSEMKPERLREFDSWKRPDFKKLQSKTEKLSW